MTLAVSGLLWESSLVMVDEETGSLWSHLLGAAMQGPLQGHELERIPSSMTDWRSWCSRYPDTTVAMLPRTATEYRRGIHLNEEPLPTYPLPDALVIGLTDGSIARCWRFDSLRAALVINDRFAGESVAAVFEPESGTASVFKRTLDDRELTLQFRDGKLVDKQTSSQWDPITGAGLTEDQPGQHLQKLPGVVSLKPAWMAFHPETTVWAEGE